MKIHRIMMLCRSHATYYLFLVCVIFESLYSSLLCCSAATDTLSFNNSIIDQREETLVSAGKTFELGFFTPGESSSNPKERYVGIWYRNYGNFMRKSVVWVANRDRPLSDGNGSFVVTEDGNLMVLDEKGNPYWSTKLKSSLSSSKKTMAKLLDSGNLVVMSEPQAAEINNVVVLWESFKNPTDTFLPGMMMDDTLNLTSWKSSDDPAPGNFRFERDNKEVYGYQVISGKWTPSWRSDDSPMSNDIVDLLSNSTIRRNCTHTGVYNGTCSQPGQRDYSNTRLVMSFTGEIQFLKWDNDEESWNLIWVTPSDKCSGENFCGKFGSRNNHKQPVCNCLPGFEPSSLVDWNSRNFSGGCIRKSAICGKSDKFLSLKMMKVREPQNDPFEATNETECEKECLNNCSCQAYSFGNSNGTDVCSIWTEDLTNLQEEYAASPVNLFVRVNISDLGVTERQYCDICGTNMIPYPLSTGPNCGDPMYFSFNCNITTGHISFQAPSGKYRVISINSNAQKFSIRVQVVDNYEARDVVGQEIQPNPSLPFHVNNLWKSNFSCGLSFGPNYEVEIGWDPPLEPTCTSSTDCKGWPHSTCKSTTGDGKKRCLCNANFQWNGSSLNCQEIRPSRQREPTCTSSIDCKEYWPNSTCNVTQDGKKMCLCKANNNQSNSSSIICSQEGQLSPRKKSFSLIIVVIFTIVIVLIALSCTIVYLRRRRVVKRRGNKEYIRRNQALHLYDSERHVKDLIDSDHFREEDKQGIDVPFFDLESIQVATDNFSDANKLGKGGFGPVYKGTFVGGREIAIKRLSSFSGQGLAEFKNEVVLIAKLQHRNLVRLLGYCIKGEEKMLLYEYMPNKSLDSFIFDQNLCAILDWELRFNIILGIARGLLYLHQDSRLRIIHRDLKTSNILLDSEMNPKISDFGLARIFEGKQTMANTNRVVGTYGYMSPEYALDGFFSVKSDVFSFGVVMLEIISGKRNTGFYQFEQALSLLGYAWRLWNENKALDLMDQTLSRTCNTNEFLKCLNVGLLCVQEDPDDRPTMSNVLFMLGSEAAALPTPKQPAFIVRRGPSSASSSEPKPWSNNELTVTVEEGR